MTNKSKNSFMPLVIAGGIALLMLGIVIFLPLFLAGIIILILGVLKVFKDNQQEKFSTTDIEQEVGEQYPLEKVGKEKTGVWVFLMSEILIFGSLLLSYGFVRLSSTSWPAAASIHNPITGMVNTIILLTSSLSMLLALYFIRTGNTLGLKIGLASTIALGITFLDIKLGFEWPALMGSGFTITNGLTASSYFVLTGIHAVHVAAGLVAVSYLLFRAFGGGFTSKKHSGVENVGLYWHFVDIVWMFLFPLFYLI
jgi:cytochrome c oxidase subunit I+III